MPVLEKPLKVKTHRIKLPVWLRKCNIPFPCADITNAEEDPVLVPKPCTVAVANPDVAVPVAEDIELKLINE